MGRHEVVNQASLRPVAKVAAGWLAGGGATAITVMVAAFSDNLDGQTVLGAAFAAIAAGVVSYVKRAKTVEQ